jgi:hypothetical protein
MTRFLFTLSLFLMGATIIEAQPIRDNRTPPGVGTGTITGRVVSDDKDGRPLRRVRVSLTNPDIDVGRATITADDGTFSFARLPMGLGADRPGRPGVGVEVRGGDNPQVTVRLPKGAVLTGVVRLPTGEPAPGILVGALTERFNSATGERQLAAPANTTVVTDDRGEYRIFGLAAGTYVVNALPRSGATPPGTEVQVLSEAEVRRALSEVKAQSVAARPGMISPPPLAPRTTDAPRGGVALVPIYFPGATSDKQAARLTVAPGEVRSGVDIDLQFVRAATIEGHVATPPGARLQIFLGHADGTSPNQPLRVATTSGEEGRFTFRSVAPGHYAISARAFSSTARPGAAAAESVAYGRTEVIVGGEDISGISIPLREALTISGRIVFNGSAAAPPLPSIRLPIPAVTSVGSMTLPLPGALVEGDRFTISGVTPGTYRFPFPPMGTRAAIGTWWLQSVLVNKRELLDGPVELQESDDQAVITFTDRPTELRGVARYTSGVPFREGMIVVFGTDPRAWFLHSVRVAAAPPTANGQYVVKNLPPGDYFITVGVGLDRNEWFDAEVLASLALSAQKLTIAKGETKTQDLTLTK